MELKDAARLEKIRAYLVDLCGVIGAPVSLLPEFGSLLGKDGYSIEADGDALSLVYQERGEASRKSTHEEDELYYWVFRDLTSELAGDWELKHRDPSEDFRVKLFSKQMELLGSLSQGWLIRYREEMADLLQEVSLSDKSM